MKNINVDIDKFKSASFREADFNENNFNKPLYNAFEMIADPKGTHTGKIPPKPHNNSKDYSGVLTGTFVEKPAYLPKNSFYFPMDGTLNAISELDCIGSETYSKSVQKNYISNLDEVFYIENDLRIPMLNYYGAHSSISIENLFDENNLLQGWPHTTTISKLDTNIVGDTKGISINPGINSTSNSFNFYAPKDGIYYLSCYVRITDPINIKNSSSTLEGFYFTKNNNPVPCEIIHPLSKGSYNTNNKLTHNVRTEWDLIVIKANLTAGNYKIPLVWNSIPEGSHLRLAGFQITNTNLFYNFDPRLQKGKYKYPLLFNLAKLSSFKNLKSSSWFLTYSRYLIGKKGDKFIDSIGNINIEYKNNKIYLGNSFIENSTYNPYNKWEHVVLMYDNSSNILYSYFYTKDYFIIGPNLTINNPYNFSSVISSTPNIHYNLGLGNYNTNNNIEITPGIYKDLIFYQGSLNLNKNEMDKEIKNINSILFSLGRTKNTNSIEELHEVTLRTSNFMETLNN